MKNNLHQIWRKGYLYIFLSLGIILLFSLNNRVGIYDWQKEVAYFQYIRESLTEYHSLPWFWWDKLDNVLIYPAISYTSNFISNPETMVLSPFIPLLYFLDVIVFIKFLTVAHWIIGAAGAFAVRKKFHWEEREFRFFILLFLLSPIIIQHISIGYTPWLNLYFFPWLLVFLADRKCITGVLGVSMVLGVVLLQGGTHVFVWYAMLVSLYLLFQSLFERKWEFLLRIFLIPGLSLCLASIRIFTTTQQFADFHQNFQAGYNPVNFSVWAVIPPVLIQPIDYFFKEKVWMGVPSWDGGIFWGWALLMLILLAIQFRKYEKTSEVVKGELAGGHRRMIYRSLFLASGVLFVCSFFSVFKFLVSTVNGIIAIPFSEGIEKYPYRLAIPAYLGFAVVLAGYSENISITMEGIFYQFVRHQRMERVVKKTKGFSMPKTGVVNECILAAGFLFAGIMWLIPSLSIPYDRYPVQHVLPPEVITTPENVKINIQVDPQRITLFTDKNQPMAGYSFPQIKYSDSKELAVVSQNAVFHDDNGMLAVLPTNGEPIIIEFNSHKFEYIFIISIVLWIAVLGMFVTGKFYHRKKQVKDNHE